MEKLNGIEQFDEIKNANIQENTVTQENAVTQGKTIVQKNIENTINSGFPQEKADSYVGTMQPPSGYVGGFFGTSQVQASEDVQIQNTTGYVGGFINQNQVQNQVQNSTYGDINSEDFDRTKLPVKRGFWSKVKSFLFEKEVELEITEKEEKVLTEIHDFLFQDISFKGFMKILRIGKDKNKNA
jgi:hypothetical protein